ncbi:MAG: sporulation protein YunB [Eubacteriales bacterium]
MRRHIRIPYRVRRRMGGMLLRAALFAAAAALLCALGDAAVRPALRTYARARAENLASAALNTAIESAAGTFGCGGLVTLEYDASGAVTALHTDTAGISRLRTAICGAALDALSEIPPSKLAVPLGSLSRSALLYGRGPRVRVAVVPSGSVRCGVDSAFESAGINQTRHTVTVTVEAEVCILLPGERLESTVRASVPVAETVLLGGVPDFYAGDSGVLR